MPRNKKRKQCEGVEDCTCPNKSVKDIFDHFRGELQALEDATESERRELLKKASPCLIKFLCEIVHNVLTDNIKLPEEHYQIFKKYRGFFVKLCSPEVSEPKRREVLKKRISKILPQLLSPLLSAVAGFAGQALSRVSF